MNGWHAYWALWALTSLVAFAIPESVAVLTGHPEWKLSQAVWVLEDAVGHPMVWRVVAGLALTGVVYHLLFGPRH
jgi:hypothetical protein